MPRVKIKHPKPDAGNKLKLLKILSEELIYATKIVITPDGFVVITKDDEEIDNIFAKKIIEKLAAEDYTPIIPPELRAKRTVLLFNVDEVIHNHQENEIIEEITANNLWIPTIDSIFKIPRTRIMKITFSETAIAKKATEKGILAFHLRIPAYNIKQDEFIPIMTCMRCYNIEDHPTSQCPKPKEYKICFECADERHTWRDCKSTNKKMHQLF